MFPADPEDGIGFELTDHMVATLSTNPSQCFGPIPAVCEKIDFTRDGESKGLEHLLGQGDFGLEGAQSFGPFRMIEFGPAGQKKVFIKQSQKYPLVAKNILVLRMIFMPGTSWNLLTCLLDDRVIHDKKEDRMSFDPQGVEELVQSGPCDLLHGPDVLSQESGKTGERSVEKRMSKGLNHGRSVHFFAQLDKANDKGGKDLERRS